MANALSLVEEIVANIDRNLDEMRHDADVLNSDHHSEEVRKLLEELSGGMALILAVDSSEHEVVDYLEHYPTEVRGRIVQAPDKEARDFNGWYVVEETQGEVHPFLLVRPERVSSSKHRS